MVRSMLDTILRGSYPLFPLLQGQLGGQAGSQGIESMIVIIITITPNMKHVFAASPCDWEHLC